MRLPEPPCPNHTSVHLLMNAITRASMPKPYFRSSSNECNYQSIIMPKPYFRSSSNECDYHSIHAQTILTKSQKYRPQRFPRENAFSGGKQHVRHPPKKTMLTLLQCCVTHVWQGFQQPHGLAPVDGAHLQTDGALLLVPQPPHREKKEDTPEFWETPIYPSGCTCEDPKQ